MKKVNQFQQLFLALFLTVLINQSSAQAPDWQTYSYSEFSPGVPSGTQQVLKVIAATNGTIYQLGTRKADNSSVGRNYTIAAFDAAGNMIHTTDGAFDAVNGNIQKNEPSSMIMDAAGNLYVSATEIFSFPDTTKSKILLAKYDASLNLLWSVFISNTYSWYVQGTLSLAMDAQENVYFAGAALITTDGSTIYASRYLMAAYDPDGNNIYTVNFNSSGGSFEWPSDLTVSSEGKAIITGSGWFDEYFIYHATTLQLNTDGSLDWENVYSTPNTPVHNDEGRLVSVDADGNVYAWLGSYIPNPITSFQYGTTLIRYDKEGNQQWVRNFNSSSPIYLYGTHKLLLDTKGNLYAVSSMTDVNQNRATTLLVGKFKTSDGSLVWQRSGNRNAAYAYTPADAVMTSDNGLFITANAEKYLKLFNFTENGILNESTMFKAADGYKSVSSSCMTISPYDGGLLIGGTAKKAPDNSHPWMLLHFNLGAYKTERGDAIVTEPLLHAFPNPATSETTISFSLDKSSLITLELSDVTGKIVRQITTQYLLSGIQKVTVNTSDLPEGIYFCKMLQNGQSMHDGIKIVVMR